MNETESSDTYASDTERSEPLTEDEETLIFEEFDPYLDDDLGLIETVTRRTMLLAQNRTQNDEKLTIEEAVTTAADGLREVYDGLTLQEEYHCVDIAELAEDGLRKFRRDFDPSDTDTEGSCQ